MEEAEVHTSEGDLRVIAPCDLSLASAFVRNALKREGQKEGRDTYRVHTIAPAAKKME